MDALGQQVPGAELAGKLVVAAAGEDKLDLILAVEHVEVGGIKRVRLARIGALDVYDLHHLARKLADVPLAAGFNQYRIACGEQSFGQRINLGLQQRLAASEFD